MRFVLAIALLLPSVAFGADVEIGPYRLEYEKSEWRIDETEAGWRAICLVERCADAIVDLAVSPAELFDCDSEAVVAAAIETFPAADRHGANPYVVGNLLVEFAFAGFGDPLSAPRAALACVTHDGHTIRIQSQLQDGTVSLGHLPAVQSLLNGLRAPDGVERDIHLVGLQLRYWSDRWQVDQMTATEVTMHCLPPECDSSASVQISVHESETCPDPLEADAYASHIDTWSLVSDHGVRWSMQSIHLGCRNLVPPLLSACTASFGRTYTITSGPGFGCRFTADVPEYQFQNLIAGTAMRVVP